MEKKVVNVYTEEDFKLLRKEIPKNPCTGCLVYLCCGCSKEVEYREIIKKYEDNNILEIAKYIKEFREINRTMIALENRRKDIMKNLDKEIVEKVLTLIV